MNDEHSEIVYRPAEVEADVAERTSTLDRAVHACNTLNIESPEDYRTAAEWLKTARDRKDELWRYRQTIVGPLNQAHKAATKLFKGPLDLLDQCARVLTSKMEEWDREQEDVRRERERELQRQAEEEARLEREEAERLAAEAEQKGDPDLAEEIRDEASAQPVLPPIVAPYDPPKVEGLVPVKRWTVQVDNLDEFVQGILSGRVPAEYAKIVPHTELLRSLGKSTEGKARVPGIRFVQETVRQRRRG